MQDDRKPDTAIMNKSAVPENLRVASAPGQETELSQMACFAGYIYLATVVCGNADRTALGGQLNFWKSR